MSDEFHSTDSCVYEERFTMTLEFDGGSVPESIPAVLKK